jgi:SAM-dependent methyltransferase
MTAVPDQRRRAFDDPDVAKAYVHRAPYPPALFVRLQELAPRAGRLLDLGCGPGKLTLPLAASFRHVDAVDPAEPMIAAAKASNAAPNIRWIVAEGNAYRSWLDIGGDEFIASTVRQSVAEFIEGEHSRGTWTRRKMGSERTAAFDAELAELLAPHAQDGLLTFEVRTRLTHGRLIAEQRGA